MAPTSTVASATGAAGALRAWASSTAGRAVEARRRLLRFAFCGRYSTEDRQNPATSYAWQHDQAEATITGEGGIVAGFFDRGQSRQLAWHLRPEAARLIEAIKDPNRGFDAIVIGSYERAFYGNQASLILPLLEKYRVACGCRRSAGRSPPDTTNWSRCSASSPNARSSEPGRAPSGRWPRWCATTAGTSSAAPPTATA
ncbi:hypothetical protein [Actinocrinis sp.]|uniref:hypothetical protein n=1 Tax=Actinocrinis sp. TaxID=1920516 RepID=UPI0039C858FC